MEGRGLGKLDSQAPKEFRSFNPTGEPASRLTSYKIHVLSLLRTSGASEQQHYSGQDSGWDTCVGPIIYTSKPDFCEIMCDG